MLVEAGHFTISARPFDGITGERLDVPGIGGMTAGTTDTTRQCFALAVAEVRALRAQGTDARLGLMVGDLALPAGHRVPGEEWALPLSYVEILDAAGLDPADVLVWGEAYARNQGKRRLLDEARRRHAGGRTSYAQFGWALLHDADGLRLASDASLEWDGDVRAAALTRGNAPLCPLVFAGLKRAIFQAGFTRHVAIYARADDPWIDLKLRAAAAIVAQLRLGAVGEQVDRIVSSPSSPPAQCVWTAADLVAPGERTWPEFHAAVRAHHPRSVELEFPCRPTDHPHLLNCLGTKTNLVCSG